MRPRPDASACSIVGLGAVATTLIAGVELAKRGQALPIGSLTQMGTIRLGKRTEDRTPLIKDFVPLAALDDIVFGAWDVFPDDAYVAALARRRARGGRHLEAISDVLRDIRPMKAAFERKYVKQPRRPAHHRHRRQADACSNAIREDINRFHDEKKRRPPGDDLVRVHRDLHRAGPDAPDLARLRGGHRRRTTTRSRRRCSTPTPRMLEGVPFANGAPNLAVDTPVLRKLATERNVPISGKDFKTGQTLMKTVLAPMLKARMLGLAGWYSTNILGNRDGEVLDDPENFKTKEESKLGVLENILQPAKYPDLYGDVYHKVAINYYPPRGDNKEGWDNIDIFGWLELPDADQGRLPLPRLDPRGAARARPGAVQRPRPARRAGRHPGVAELLLQEPAGARPACTPSTTCSSSSPS